MSITISSGHAKYVAGAFGIVKEVEQARKLVDRITSILKGVMPVQVFHDDVSRTQKDNLNRIVAFHNRTGSKYHYSMHLNSSGNTTANDMGVEVLYAYDVDQAHAATLASAISEATGLKNRGAKKRTNLAFLCAPRRLLIEAYFVNSGADVGKMDEAAEIEKFAYAAAVEMCKVQNIKLPTKNTASQYHVIQAGDSLWSIARNHKTTVEQIKKLNVLKSDVIKPGQKLKVK